MLRFARHDTASDFAEALPCPLYPTGLLAPLARAIMGALPEEAMIIHDISIPLSPTTPVYPGDAGAEVVPSRRLARGDAFNLSVLHLGSHAGTHIDPPFHFFDDGATVDALPLEVFVGEAWLADLEGVTAIGPEHLEALGLPPHVERLLLKTQNSRLWSAGGGFQRDFAYLTPEGARWVVERGARLLGFDYLSLEKFGPPPAVSHQVLLGAGVAILEGVDLSRVGPGRYTLICLPLYIRGGDGSPCRAILIEE